MRLFLYPAVKLLNSNFGAADGLAGEAADAAGLEGNNAVFVSVDGEVAGSLGAGTCALGHANLAHDNLALVDLLATKYLNTEALALAVASIFGCTTCFYV
jgi:hypothetical protein